MSQTEDTRVSTPKRKRPKRKLAFHVIIGLFVLLTVLFFLAAFMRPEIDFAPGEPRNCAELVTLYPDVPREQNAALWFNALVDSKQLDKLNAAIAQETDIEERRRLLDRNGRVSIGEVGLVTIEQALAASTNGLEKLHELLQMPDSRFPIDLAQGPNVELSHLAALLAGSERGDGIHGWGRSGFRRRGEN